MTFYTIKQSDDHAALTYAYGYNAELADAESCKFCGARISLLIWQPPFRVELGYDSAANSPTSSPMLTTVCCCLNSNRGFVPR